MIHPIDGRLPSKVVLRQRSSSVRGHLPSKVVFCWRSFSVKGRLLSKVVFRQRSYSIEGRHPLLGYFHFCPAPCAFQQCASRLLSKVAFRQRASSVKSRLLSKVVFCQKLGIFHTQCAQNEEDKVAMNVLVNLSKVSDKVVITKKAKAPIDKRKEKKDARNNLLFYNK